MGDVPPEAIRQALLGFGVLEWHADGLVEDYGHYRRGEAVMLTLTVRDITDGEAMNFPRLVKA